MAVLESRLVITGVDNTQAAFDTIRARIEGLSAKVASANLAIGKTGSAVAAASAGVRNGALARRGTGTLGALSSVGGVAATATGLGGVYGVGLAARGAAEAIGVRQHEQTRMAVAGETPEEMQAAQVEVAKLAEQFPNVSQADLLHMLRNARSMVGSYKEAAEIAEPLTKLRTLAQLQRPSEDVSEDFDQLIKGLEIKGVTQKPEQFREYMEGIAKAINVFGDTLKPYQYYEMFKYGRQATPALSEQFILGTAPTLAQELGGEGFGAAVAQFNKLLVAGVGKKGAFDELARLGLIEKDAQADIPGTGEGVGLKAGRTVSGWRLAQADPNEWVKQYLLPSMAKAGITDQDAILREIGILFQSGKAGQMAGLFATQQSKIVKDTALIKGAGGLSAADQALHEDPGLAWTGLKNSVSGLVGAMGESIGAAGVMSDAAKWISGVTADVAKETAARAKGEGWLDRARFDAKAKDSLFGAGYRDRDLEQELERERSRAAALGPPPPFRGAPDLPTQAPPAFRGASDWETRAGGLNLPAMEPAKAAPLSTALNMPAQAPAAKAPQEIVVNGQAQVEHVVHVEVTLDPGLRAAIDNLQKSLDFTVPLIGGGSGRMDSDAGAHRVGGIGSM